MKNEKIQKMAEDTQMAEQECCDAQEQRQLVTPGAGTPCLKYKVVFTASSGRAGQTVMMDKGLARLYEKQGKIIIINNEKGETV